jgi:hypothetical protein
MRTMSPDKQKRLLISLLAALAVLVAYRVATSEKPRTVPLVYSRGAIAASSGRTGIQQPSSADPLQVFLALRGGKFPGVGRDLFRMENPAPKLKAKPLPEPPVVAPLAAPVITPEEIAADASRADLSKFRFLGYLTDKDSTLFLSKDGELFMVKSGDQVLKNYRIKEAGKDFVILLDTVTHVEVRVELSGSGEQAPLQQKPK